MERSLCMLLFLIAMSSVLSVEGDPGSCYFHHQTLPIPMYAHQGIFSAAKNAVYLFGGYSGTTWANADNLNKVYKWDLSNPSAWFVEIGTTPSTGWFASFIHNAVVANYEVYFIGMDHNSVFSGQLFVYDLNTESFLPEQKTRMPYPSFFGCLSTNTTHIFMVDGHDSARSDVQRLPIIQVYDIATDTWQSHVLDAGPLAYGWSDQYCSLVGDALYVLAGIIKRPVYNYNHDIYRINTLTFEIEQLNATLPYRAFGTSIYADQNFYLFGAIPHRHDVAEFNLETLAVATTATFRSQQLFSSAPVLRLNGSIYRFGGSRNGSEVSFFALDQVEICDLPTDIPTQSPTEYPTNAPTAIPTATPSSLPTSVPPTKTPTASPSLIPTQVPTLTPTILPSILSVNATISMDAPSTIPSQLPTLMPSLSTDDSTTPTASPTYLPRLSPPNSNEYGVDINIKFDGVLPQNETDALMTALHEYALKTVNTTNCSERMDVSSQQTAQENDQTVIKMSIVTCSEAIERELLVAFDATVLEYDIINIIVTAADVEEISTEGIFDDATTENVPVDDAKRKYWYLILLAVLLVFGVVGVAFWIVRRGKTNQRKDAEQNIPDADLGAQASGQNDDCSTSIEELQNAVELQKCGSNKDKNKVDMYSEQMASVAGGNQAHAQQGLGLHTPAMNAEIFDAIHSFNARQAHMMATDVMNHADEDESEDDDDMFGDYEEQEEAQNEGVAATNTGTATGVADVQDDELQENDEPITAEGDLDDDAVQEVVASTAKQTQFV